MATLVTVLFENDDDAEILMSLVDYQVREMGLNGKVVELPLPQKVMHSERVEVER